MLKNHIQYKATQFIKTQFVWGNKAGDKGLRTIYYTCNELMVEMLTVNLIRKCADDSGYYHFHNIMLTRPFLCGALITQGQRIKLNKTGTDESSLVFNVHYCFRWNTA